MVSLNVHQQRQLNRMAGYLGLAVIVIIIGTPVFWMLSSSIKTLAEVRTFPPVWVTSDPRFANFKDAWNAVPIDRFYINSLVITLAGASLQLVNGVLCAYAFAFLKFPYKNWLFLFVLGALMVPAEVVI